MKENRNQIILAYLYHVFFILMGFILMQDYADGLLTVSIVVNILYLGYWIALNRKKYMPWIVYINFLIGSVIEGIFNLFGIIPGDNGFLSGIGQFLYLFSLLIWTAFIGLTNTVLWLIDKKRKK